MRDTAISLGCRNGVMAMENTPHRRCSFPACALFAARRVFAWSLFGLVCLAGLLSDAQPLARLANADAQSAAPRVRFVKDTVDEEIATFRHDVRQLYNNSRFDELEKIATELLAAKAKFANGWWKIVRYYDSLECRNAEPENRWRLHDRIH